MWDARRGLVPRAMQRGGARSRVRALQDAGCASRNHAGAGEESNLVARRPGRDTSQELNLLPVTSREQPARRGGHAPYLVRQSVRRHGTRQCGLTPAVSPGLRYVRDAPQVHFLLQG